MFSSAGAGSGAAFLIGPLATFLLSPVKEYTAQ